MKITAIALACSLAFAGAALAQTSENYVKRTDARFGTFTGSTANTESLATGLRSGSEITLTGSGETATFTPPTRPMGYGNITRSLDLAQRQLAAAGISEPTPAEIQAALMGGSVSGPSSDVTFQGILQMRADGMGWGQIAHAVGVHPGLGKATTSAAPAGTAASSGVTTAGAKSGIVNAAGGRPASPAAQGNGRALGLTTGGGASAAAGASSAGGNAGGKAQGNAFGRAGR